MKSKKVLAFISVLAVTFSAMPVHADDTDYSNTAYWTEKCSDLTRMGEDDKNACAAFVKYMSDQSDSLSQKLIEIDSRRNEVAANIDEYEQKISDYQNTINDLGTQMNDLQSQIDDLQKQVDDLTAKEADLKEKVKMQMESNQSTMRISKYVDILAGARSFSDFLKIASGLHDITKHSSDTVQEYKDTVTQLSSDQQKLTDSQNELESKKEDAVAAQYQAQVIQEEYEAQKSDLDQQYEDAQVSADQLNATAEQLAQQQAQAEAAFEQEKARAAAAKAAEEAARQQQQQSSSNSGGTTQGGQTNNSGSNSNDTPTTPDNSSSGRSDADSYELGVQIVEYARQFLGYPYVWAANGPDAFDCSGFTKYVYGHFGIYIARYSETQDTYGYAIPESEARAGDLVHWPGHVGIVSGWGLYNGNYVPYTINAMNPQYGICIMPIPVIYTSTYSHDYRRLF